MLATAVLVGGCGGPSAPVPPTLTPAGPAVAAPVAPIQAIPKRITVASIGVDAEVVGIGLDNNQFELKPLDANPKLAGWYLYGPPPGSAGPPALIMSHINFNGVPGAFNHLDKVKVGDKITVTRSGGSPLTFTTTRVSSVLKKQFDPATAYAPTPDAELLLITCGGQYDAAHRNYLSNTVVRAVLDK